jgi:CheY-like chemotaxis protein
LWKDKPHLPVIFSSGYTQEMTSQHEEDGHLTAYLSKPYRPAQLVQAVREALDNGQRDTLKRSASGA